MSRRALGRSRRLRGDGLDNLSAIKLQTLRIELRKALQRVGQAQFKHAWPRVVAAGGCAKAALRALLRAVIRPSRLGSLTASMLGLLSFVEDAVEDG